MSVDSGLPDFRGDDGLWRAYPPLKQFGLSFTEVAQPSWFEDNPWMAWAFYGHRQQLYREAVPHEGYRILHSLAETMPGGYFVFTSNVDRLFLKAGFDRTHILERHGSIFRLQCTKPCTDEVWPVDSLNLDIHLELLQAFGELPQCPGCGGPARPNILMFEDYEWVPNETRIEQKRYADWLDGLSGAPIVVIECGAGTGLPRVRAESERIAERFDAPLIRVNPDAADAEPATIHVPLGALEALTRIGMALDGKSERP
jgi:NAD-dependent SIR2 family protein deacetylase